MGPSTRITDKVYHRIRRLRVTYLPTERQRFWRGSCVQTVDGAVLNRDTRYLLDLQQVINSQ